MAIFITKHKSLELVIDPAYYETKQGKRIMHKGKRIIFTRGEFRTTDKEKIDFLLNHNRFNDAFYLQTKLILCEYCERNFDLKMSKITHEKYCEKNPNKKETKKDKKEE